MGLAQHPGHDLAAEPALHQEAPLARPLGGVFGRCAEAPAPDLAGTCQLGAAQLGHRGTDEIVVELVLFQFLSDARIAQAGTTPTHQGFDKALRRQEALRLEGVEQRRQRLRALGMRRQLARELHAGVLARGQCLQGPGLQREAAEGHAGRGGRPYSAAGVASSPVGSRLTPRDSRMRFSISWARSGFSRRNSRALSLPWPIFSPL